MTENESINGWTFEETVKTAENLMETENNMFKWDVLRHLRDFAENFKEELEQYRAIGTVEGYENVIKAYEETYNLMKKYKSKLQEYEAIGTIEDYWKLNEMCKEYSAIGTIEELQALKEKSEPKKVKKSGVTDSNGVFHAINGINGVPYDLCPNCEINLCTDGIFGGNTKGMKYCKNCGQKLDWH